MSECSNCKQAIDCCACSAAPTPAPVLPKCHDVDLVDGTFTNATVVVSNGCVVDVQQGAAPLYTPDPCCATPGGGGGGGGTGPQGEPGPPGAAATVTVGTVTTLAPGSPATVTNSGSPSAAVLNFGIPRGADGAGGGGGSGLTGDFAGLELQDGAVQQLPMAWPPVLAVIPSGLPGGVVVTASEDAMGTLTLTVDLTAYDTALRAFFQTQIDTMAATISAMNTSITTLQTDMTAAKAQLTALCAGNPCP